MIPIKISAENEIRGETTIENQCTGKRNRLFPFLMEEVKDALFYFLPEKMVYLPQTDVIFCKNLLNFKINSLPKRKEVKFIRNESDLAILRKNIRS